MQPLYGIMGISENLNLSKFAVQEGRVGPSWNRVTVPINKTICGCSRPDSDMSTTIWLLIERAAVMSA